MIELTFLTLQVRRIAYPLVCQANSFCTHVIGTGVQVFCITQFSDYGKPRCMAGCTFHTCGLMPNSSGMNAGQVLSFVAITDVASRVPMTADSCNVFP